MTNWSDLEKLRAADPSVTRADVRRLRRACEIIRNATSRTPADIFWVTGLLWEWADRPESKYRAMAAFLADGMDADLAARAPLPKN